MSFNKTNTSSAFTIVELLIVVVVIAILAAITIVSYSGITSQAEDSSLKSALKTAANKIEIEKIRTESYPANEDALASLGLELDSGSYNLKYTRGTSGSSYCISAFLTKNPDKVFSVSSADGEVKSQVCEGHVTEIASNTPIQNISQSQCQALPTYTGTNEDALRTVTDARGGTTRDYRIAKLADSNCWMLDNLKLGSTTSSITLTPGDSDVSSNFTLPQLITIGTASHDYPGAYGPVPGDTGSGTTNYNYGYQYNWPAATAGETQASMPAGSGNAPHSICPANWRLPRGAAVLATNEFAMLNAKMNNPDATSPTLSAGTGFYQNWQHTGTFKGVSTRTWSGSFGAQRTDGHLWSSSAHTSTGSSAFGTYFSPSLVSPGDFNNSRGAVRGVRCLLN